MTMTGLAGMTSVALASTRPAPLRATHLRATQGLDQISSPLTAISSCFEARRRSQHVSAAQKSFPVHNFAPENTASRTTQVPSRQRHWDFELRWKHLAERSGVTLNANFAWLPYQRGAHPRTRTHTHTQKQGNFRDNFTECVRN